MLFLLQLDSCSLNKFFITSTLILSVTVSVIAILPWIQRGKTVDSISSSHKLSHSIMCPCTVQPKSGLLQAAVVSGYCTYQTWSAISTEPYGSSKLTVYSNVFSVTCASSLCEYTGRNCDIGESEFAVFSDNGNALAASIVGILVLLITVAYIW